MWVTHHTVRMTATVFACLSVSPTFSPRLFAQILHHLLKFLYPIFQFIDVFFNHFSLT
jgi:hypothetical protein